MAHPKPGALSSCNGHAAYWFGRASYLLQQPRLAATAPEGSSEFTVVQGDGIQVVDGIADPC